MDRADWLKVKERIDALPAPIPPPPKEPVYLPLSTPRASLCRKRRRQGLRVATVLLSEEELDGLVHLLFLPSEQRTNPPAIANALAAYLHSSLVERFVHTIWAKMAREQRQGKRFPDRPPWPRPQTPLSPEPGP